MIDTIKADNLNKNKLPYLIKIGKKYFIIFEEKHFEVGEAFDRAFDIFYKCFHVFNVNYNKNYENIFFNFFDFFIYKIEMGTAGSMLEKLYGKIIEN